MLPRQHRAREAQSATEQQSREETPGKVTSKTSTDLPCQWLFLVRSPWASLRDGIPAELVCLHAQCCTIPFVAMNITSQRRYPGDEGPWRADARSPVNTLQKRHQGSRPWLVRTKNQTSAFRKGQKPAPVAFGLGNTLPLAFLN